MATFTLELWRVIDLKPEGMSADEWLGLSTYPIFDANYRAGLNQKIIDHFHNREIGQETDDMFRFALKRKMNEIMPLMNKLYESERIQFDPLSTVNLRTLTSSEDQTTATGESNNTTTTGNESGSRAVQSNTPQMMLAGNKDYATSAADTNSKSESTATAAEESNSSNQSTASGESSVTGYQGIASQLLMAYRESLMNVDMLIIEQLEDLFMLVWNTTDEYTTTKGWMDFQ